MGEQDMSMEYNECIKRNKLRPFPRGKSLVLKEIETSVSDLDSAKKTYKGENYKWATIQVYYSMFHSARALLYAKDMRERSHFCLIAAIRTLYVDTKIIPVHLLEALQEAKNLREEADYYNRWSQQGCERLLRLAEEFLKIAKETIKHKKY